MFAAPAMLWPWCGTSRAAASMTARFHVLWRGLLRADATQSAMEKRLLDSSIKTGTSRTIGNAAAHFSHRTVSRVRDRSPRQDGHRSRPHKDACNTLIRFPSNAGCSQSLENMTGLRPSGTRTIALVPF
jgi:hypothetical protein